MVHNDIEFEEDDDDYTDPDDIGYYDPDDEEDLPEAIWLDNPPIWYP